MQALIKKAHLSHNLKLQVKLLLPNSLLSLRFFGSRSHLLFHKPNFYSRYSFTTPDDFTNHKWLFLGRNYFFLLPPLPLPNQPTLMNLKYVYTCICSYNIYNIIYIYMREIKHRLSSKYFRGWYCLWLSLISLCFN